MIITGYNNDMKIIVIAVSLWLMKLAVMLVVSWLAKEKLKRMSKKQKGAFFAGLWGMSVAALKAAIAWF